MHARVANIDIDRVIQSEPLTAGCCITKIAWVGVGIGVLTFSLALVYHNHDLLWGAYFTNLLFFMGLAVGSVVLTAIFQIVRATWAAPIRRIAEASYEFLPWAYGLWAVTYFGKESLYPWATHPMPGREWWFQPNFVYIRFAILLGILFLVIRRFIRLSLRGDIGLIQEKNTSSFWKAPLYKYLTSGWEGSEVEIPKIQNKMSCSAPVIVMLYIVIYSLFVFDMVMSMDTVWYANMFGGFNFVGNIYLALATLSLVVTYLRSTEPEFNKIVTADDYWDMGKLTFGFCMLWTYMFFAHFLPQWYGNLPEETAWMMLRTREFPWKGWAWFVLPMCFIIPFITSVSRDVKRTPKLYAFIAASIFFGIWGEKYIVVMPQISPDRIPFGLCEIGLFLGFAGGYILCIQNFIRKFPYVQVSHPLTRGVREW